MRTTKPKWICLKDEQPKYMAEAVIVAVGEEKTLQRVSCGFFVPPFNSGDPLRFCPRRADATYEGDIIPKTYRLREEDWPNIYYFVYKFDDLEKTLEQ